MATATPPATLDDLAARGRRLAAEAQARLLELGVGRGGAFLFDQPTARLTFTREGEIEPFLAAEASLLGSFSRGSWLWAWANESILPGACRAARETREIGLAYGIRPLADPAFAGDEAEVERLVMAAFGALSPAAFYKVPTRGGFAVLFLHTIDAAVPARKRRAAAKKKAAAKKAAAKKAPAAKKKVAAKRPAAKKTVAAKRPAAKKKVAARKKPAAKRGRAG